MSHAVPCWPCPALIFEHIVLLLSEALLERELTKNDTLNSLINDLFAAQFIDEAEKDELHALRTLRNNAVHQNFKHSGIDVKAKFLEMHSGLMAFLNKRFVTGGGVPPAPRFLELRQGAYYIKPSFEADKFVQKFWLPRCIPAASMFR
jgi:hypothetical protein